MKLAQIEEAISKLCLKADAKAQERILGDALAMLEAAPRPSALGRRLSGVRMAGKSLPLRLAGAAAIIAIAYIGAQYLAAGLEGSSDVFAIGLELTCKNAQGFFGY